jgi:hypothetical protein
MSKYELGAPVVVQQQQEEVSRDIAVLKEVIALDRSLETNAFVLGDLFAEIIDKEYYKSDGCQTLKEFLKKRAFDLSPREITYRANVSRKSKKLGISREELLAARVTKAKVVCVLDPDLVYTHESGVEESMGDIIRSLIKSAPTSTVAELKELVNMYLGKTEADKPIKETIFFEPEEWKLFDFGVLLATKIAGATLDIVSGESRDLGRGSACAILAVNYINDPNNAPAVAALKAELGHTVIQDEAVDEAVESGDDDGYSAE